MSQSRRRLLDLLADQSVPTSLAAVVAMTGLHENTVRGHLDGLEEAGLVSRVRAAPDGRGRPAHLWSAIGPGPVNEYAGLAGALAATLHHTSPDPVADAAEAGRAWGADLGRQHLDRDGRTHSESVTGTRREVVDLMDDLGFAPESGPRAERIRLTRCPLLEVARRHTDIVCSVHLGLVEGAQSEYAAAYGSSETEATLVPFAEPGACLLRL